MNPGSPHASVTQPPPFLPRTSPSARSARVVSSICSASSSSETSRWGSGGEELDILLLPPDAHALALAPPQRRIMLARSLHEEALATCGEMELHQIAQELDENHLALGRVDRAGAAVLIDPCRRRPNRDERLRARRPRVFRRPHARPDTVRVLDHQPATGVLHHGAADDVVVAHEPR